MLPLRARVRRHHAGHRGRSGRALGRRLLRPRSHADLRILGRPPGLRRPAERPHRTGGPRAHDGGRAALPARRARLLGARVRGGGTAKGRDRGHDGGSRRAPLRGATRSRGVSRSAGHRPRAPAARAHDGSGVLGHPLPDRAPRPRSCIEHVLCTKLEVRDGRFTGAVETPLCYGEGKLEAARHLATKRGVDLGESFFYTDSDEDLPLLEHVGRPRPTNPNRKLATIAARRGWPARTFHTRGFPSVMDVVRTSLSVASLGPSLLLGVPAGILEGSWRQVINIAATTWGELGSALAGIRVSVTGEEHLWSHRPAVFIFNHQSAIDALILCKLLHRDFVAISKQELRRNPIFGPVFALAGTVFIDRSDRTKAIEALQPATQALREGLSIAIAPE